MKVYICNYAVQATSVMVDMRDMFHLAFVQGYTEMADVLELTEAKDGGGLLVLVERTWEQIETK